MDRDIIEYLSQRDQRSIELVAERYEKLLRYIIASILGERQETVEECLNDVYLKIWMKGQGYDYEKASFKTYLKAIARNSSQLSAQGETPGGDGTYERGRHPAV